MKMRGGAFFIFACALCACSGQGSAVLPGPTPTRFPHALAQRISTDPFQGLGGQFATEVEPSIASDGRATIVAAFQQGRDLVAGGDAIGFATSLDGGITWTGGTLPGITRANGGAFTSASDAVVAYDASHHIWLVSSIPVLNEIVPYVTISRSGDGVHWQSPVIVQTNDVSDDKEWIACDNGTASPWRGRCYATWDDAGANGLLHASRSSDGGATWSMSIAPPGAPSGIGGQILIAPNGNVTIVTDTFNEDAIFAFGSHDGGATWTNAVGVASITDHFQLGLRSGPLVTAAMDGAGIAYAIWQDCRFRAHCAQDDLVMSTSTDGVRWNAPSRIPLDFVTSNVDHFVPGLGVDPTTAAGTAHLALTFYAYANSACTAPCALQAEFSTSSDGGVSWTMPMPLSAPMLTSSLSQTTQGRMTADYGTAVFLTQRPIVAFIFANPPNGAYDEATYATLPGSLSLSGPRVPMARNERPIPGAHSDHPSRRIGPPRFPRNGRMR